MTYSPQRPSKENKVSSTVLTSVHALTPPTSSKPSMLKVEKTYRFDPHTDLIGQGGFGSVYKAYDENLGIHVALKKYSGNMPNKYSLFEEIKRVIQLNHTNLVRYYDAFEIKGDATFADKIQVGVMELVNGGDLLAFLKSRPSTEQIREVLVGILHGLGYLHAKGIIHRDLKPENILLQKDGSKLTAKIADFGISKVIGQGSGTGASSLVIGSVEYMAPEQFNQQRYGRNGTLSTNLDLWSLGAIIYEAFSGSAPFGKTTEGVPRDEVMRNILDKDDIDFTKVPEPFRSIVKRCLVRDANQRARSVDELLGLLGQNAGNATEVQNFRVSTGAIGGTTVMRNGGSNLGATPANANKEEFIRGLHEQRELQEKRFYPGALIPILTAIAGIAFFFSKVTILGNAAQTTLWTIPSIFCAAMALINLISLFIRRFKYKFEYVTYMASFVVLFYFLVQGMMNLHYLKLKAEHGITMQFATSDFAQLYPYVGGGLIVFSIVAALISWRRQG